MASLSKSRIALIATAVFALGTVGASMIGSRSPPAPVSTSGNNSDASDPRPETVIAQVETALKKNPGDARGWRVLGSARRETGDFAGSAVALRKAVALEPDNAEGWALLGEAIALSSPPPMSVDARDAFGKALKKDPREPLARYYLAVALDMDGDHRGAIEDWFALLNVSPRDAPWIPEVRQAIERVAAANRIDVGKRLAAAAKPGARTAPGTAADANRDRDVMVNQMVDGLARKLAANPRDIDGWLMLMRSRMALGQRAEAKKALSSAKAANPASVATLDKAARDLGI